MPKSEIRCAKCGALNKLDHANEYPLRCQECREPSPALIELDRCEWTEGDHEEEGQ
jgi:hypothetical protein